MCVTESFSNTEWRWMCVYSVTVAPSAPQSGTRASFNQQQWINPTLKRSKSHIPAHAEASASENN